MDFGRRHGIVIVNDNPYSFIRNDRPLSILQVEGAADMAIEMNSPASALNMAGWRVGMLVSNPVFVGVGAQGKEQYRLRAAASHYGRRSGGFGCRPE